MTKPVVPPVVEPAPQSIVPKPTEPNPELENEEEEEMVDTPATMYAPS